MKRFEPPPLPREMAGRAWKVVFVCGACFAWGLLVYGLYVA